MKKQSVAIKPDRLGDVGLRLFKAVKENQDVADYA
jgi:hypothetical protein